ncbi:MAG: GIN domain-containing protein [Steroidobacteraceae bacterium]
MNRTPSPTLAGLFLALTALAALPGAAHAGDRTTVTRAYPWHSDQLILEVPADVRYHPAPTWSLTISAPQRTLRELVVGGGRIKAKPHTCFSLIPFCMSFGTDLHHTVQVNLSGPALRVIRVDGSADLALDQVHQDRLALRIDGSANVHGSGTVQQLTVTIDGSGTVHLGHLSEQRAGVHINGNGTVSIAPTDSVSVNIAGVGTVRLHSDPPHVTTHIEGVGEVTRVPAAG